MCFQCSKHSRKYLIEDRLTGLILCEECGYAVEVLNESGYRSGRYIWEANPAWPVFHSFEELMLRIFEAVEDLPPPCRLVDGIPSLILTKAFDMLWDFESKVTDRD